VNEQFELNKFTAGMSNKRTPMSEAASSLYPSFLLQAPPAGLRSSSADLRLSPADLRLPSPDNPVKGKGVVNVESAGGQPPTFPIRTEIETEASKNQSEDVRLVGCAQKGDAVAFDQLVLKHSGKLYGLVFNMTNNHHDTNDLLQDIWTKVYRSLAGFRGGSRFTTWLHSIAVNMTINFVKRRARKQTVSLDESPVSEDGAPLKETILVSPHTPRTEATLSELQSRLTHALEQLTPEHRAVVTMFDIHGMPHAEISRILSVSEGTVRSRLFYAHKQLQNFLADFHTQLTDS